MAMSNHAQHSKREQDSSHHPLKSAERKQGPRQRRQYDGGSHRENMTEAKREQRLPDRGAAALLHAQRHGKKPAHAGIDAVKSAEQQESDPIPFSRMRHSSPQEKQYESEEASPPWSRTWCGRRSSNSMKKFLSI